MGKISEAIDRFLEPKMDYAIPTDSREQAAKLRESSNAKQIHRLFETPYYVELKSGIRTAELDVVEGKWTDVLDDLRLANMLDLFAEKVQEAQSEGKKGIQVYKHGGERAFFRFPKNVSSELATKEGLAFQIVDTLLRAPNMPQRVQLNPVEMSRVTSLAPAA